MAQGEKETRSRTFPVFPRERGGKKGVKKGSSVRGGITPDRFAELASDIVCACKLVGRSPLAVVTEGKL